MQQCHPDMWHTLTLLRSRAVKQKQKPTTSQVQMETCGGVKSSTCPNFSYLLQIEHHEAGRMFQSSRAFKQTFDVLGDAPLL